MSINKDQSTVLISHLHVYRAIAEEAAAKSLKSLNEHRTPKPNGQPGFILHGDNGVSFKEALIAIAFSGIYLEALMAIVQRQSKASGKRFVSKGAKEGRYGGKLQAIGIKDPELIAEANHFNDARDELIHENSYELKVGVMNHVPGVKHFCAQDEAQRSVKLIKRVAADLEKIHGTDGSR